jgi:hypothetical protein
LPEGDKTSSSRSGVAGTLLAAAAAIALSIDFPPAGAAGPSSIAEARPGSLAGRWSGQYRYNDRRLPPKAFTAAIAQGKGPAFSGRITEPRFSRTGAAGLMSATIAGSLGPKATISFVKRYVGVAGFANAVRYEGRLAKDGRTIKGTWRIPEEKLRGTFEMRRSGG